MTYPPQQPGPWGQQPDPYGQQPGQSPWGQQPDPYGQSPWGQQPYQMGPPPKKKGGLMAALIIVAVLVVGGGGAGLYFLLSKDEKDPAGGGTSTEAGPRAAADAFTEELQKLVNVTSAADLDVSPLEPHLCGDDYSKLEEELAEAKESEADSTSASNPGPSQKVTLSVEDFKETDDGATFNLRREVGENHHDQELKVVDEDDKWVVCGLYAEAEDEPATPPSSGSDGGSGGPDASIPNPIPTS